MNDIAGGCICGNVQYNINCELDPALQFTCHCRDCQHVSGAGHVRSFGVPSVQVEWNGVPKVYEITHEKTVVDTAFCADCGSPIYKKTSAMPELVFFHAGSLNDDCIDLYRSTQQAFPESRQSWDVLD